MPTLVPKPGSPTVTQEQLPGRKSDALRALGLPWVTLDHEICSLKIRVLVVRLTRIGSGRSSPFGQVDSTHPASRPTGALRASNSASLPNCRCPDSLRESVCPWPPLFLQILKRHNLGAYRWQQCEVRTRAQLADQLRSPSTKAKCQ